jgi:hypothetical protein
MRHAMIEQPNHQPHKAWNDRRWLILLLVINSAIYTFYFGDIFARMNAVLSSITGDALKNYYTYAFHITRDKSMLHFEGMNYPYGEHVVFTDCQPLLTFILRLLPFTHNYLIGILHFLMFGSFVFSPLIIFRILRLQKMDQLVSFFTALALNLLAPQFAKIHGGHHGLAYGFVVPAAIFLIQKTMLFQNHRNLLYLSIYNVLLFFLHPYLGFGVTLFACLSFLIMAAASRKLNKTVARNIVLAGILPVIIFKVFMLATDHHPDRTTEPYGYEALVENPSTLLSPDYGPFKSISGQLLPDKIIHFEGHSYLGMFVVIGLIVCLIFSCIYFRRIKLNATITTIFLSSVILLLIAFGYHNYLLKTLNLKISALNQFRAVCRFAWFFYYTLPLFILLAVFRTTGTRGTTLRCITGLYLVFNLFEAHYYFTYDRPAFWKSRNILNEKYLTETERSLIENIKGKQVQAILPLPLFHLGSELYDRAGGDNSMIPSLFISYHTGLPVMGCWMSRTSMSETEAVIGILNKYKRERPVLRKLSEKDMLVFRTKDPLLPDEERLIAKAEFFYKNDSLEIGTVNRGAVNLARSQGFTANINDTNTSIKFLKTEDRNPFIPTSNKDYHKIFVLDSNVIPEGRYVVSMHYHYPERNYKFLAANLIVTEGNGAAYGWKYNTGFSMLSGVYKGRGVYENFIEIKKGHRYEFVTKGNADIMYKVSRFLLRPDSLNVMEVTSQGDTLFNNFPVKDELKD